MVAITSRYSTFTIDLGTSRNINSVEEYFSALHPFSGPSILMGADSDILVKGIVRITLNNGYFNNVLFVPDIVSNILALYKLTHMSLAKRVAFTEEDVEISEVSSRKVVELGVVDHE